MMRLSAAGTLGLALAMGAMGGASMDAPEPSRQVSRAEARAFSSELRRARGLPRRARASSVKFGPKRLRRLRRAAARMGES